jgi:hypothetical protein
MGAPRLYPEERLPRPLSVRLPTSFIAWLHDRASENATSVGYEIRTAVGSAIIDGGWGERYGVADPDDGSSP